MSFLYVPATSSRAVATRMPLHWPSSKSKRRWYQNSALFPKDAMSTPSNLSLVERSLPRYSTPAEGFPNVAARTSACSTPGLHNPYGTPPPTLATSPAANMFASVIDLMRISTLMPPRGPISKPHCRANSSLGLTPQDTTTRSTSSFTLRPSSSNSSASTPSLPKDTSCNFTRVCTSTPSASTLNLRSSPATLSSCATISCGATSRTCARKPKSTSALAASRPNKPPPTTAAHLLDLALSSSALTSSMVRYVKTPGTATSKFRTGGTKGALPVVSTSSS
mmetsp:Transcript_48028/g.112181  ORF Transcript_48028/g.112181 Transcript_48028/m.112181 type:complete len:279 (+) Transcript_48028:272-1108(+)